MAKVTSNPAIGELTGRIGNLVFAKYKSGLTVIRQRPRRQAAKTPTEAANQKDFAQAVAYAKAVWATRPELRAKYIAAARMQGRQGFQLAKADFRRPPKVQDIELSGYTGQRGGIIRIEAVDDFEVKGVLVVIRDLAGVVIEQGPAVFGGGQWNYTAQRDMPAGAMVGIEATATDHPGHAATRRAEHACRGSEQS